MSCVADDLEVARLTPVFESASSKVQRISQQEDLEVASVIHVFKSASCKVQKISQQEHLSASDTVS